MFDNITSVKTLFNYNFGKHEELGTQQKKFNGGTRFDVLSDRNSSVIRSPRKLLRLLNYLRNKHGTNPAYGVKNKRASVPFLMGDSIGIFYHAQNKVLNITQLIQIERAMREFNLSTAVIFAINYSKPVLDAIRIMNGQGLQVEINYINSIIKAQAN